MRKLFSIFSFTGGILLLLSLQTNLSSCTKEKIIHDTVTVTVTVQVPVYDTSRLTSQPNCNENEVHLYGAVGNDQSDPTAPEFGAEAWTSGGSNVFMRALLKFDFTDIPVNARIVSAKLTLYSNPTPLNGNPPNANFGTDNTMLIQRVTSSWNKTANWNLLPTSTATDQIIIPHTPLSKLDLIDIDVSKLVSEMVKANNNFGFLLRLQNEITYNSRIFCSSKYSDVTKHPKLVVEYAKK